LAGKGIARNFNPLFLARQHDLTDRDGKHVVPIGTADFSSRMSGIKFRRRLFPALGDHFCRIGLSRHSPRPELFSLDVIFGLPRPPVIDLPANLNALVVNLPACLSLRCHLSILLPERLGAGMSRARSIFDPSLSPSDWIAGTEPSTSHRSKHKVCNRSAASPSGCLSLS
jgi:hypothetical protein